MPRSAAAAALVMATLASSGCEYMSRRLALYDEALQLTIDTSEVPTAGDEAEFLLRLTNRGTQVVDACLGWSRSVSLHSEGSGGTADRWVDHPGCVERFTLEPGEELAWVDLLPTPSASPGSAELDIVVEIVDPEYCGAFGCARTEVRARKDVVIRARR